MPMKKCLNAIWKNKALYMLALPVLVYIFIFNYLPIYGVQIAFRNYTFSRGITGAEKQVSGDYIKRNIRKLLAAEPGLPDNAVAERIKSCGIEIARRTVAKYRREMGIASSYRRNKEKI